MFSSKQFLPGTSVGTYHVANIKLEEEIDIKEEDEVNVKNEDIDIKDEKGVYSEEDIKDEEGVYSEEEDQEDIDTREYKEVEVKEETIEYEEVEVKEEGILNEKFREHGATEQRQEIQARLLISGPKMRHADTCDAVVAASYVAARMAPTPRILYF